MSPNTHWTHKRFAKQMSSKSEVRRGHKTAPGHSHLTQCASTEPPVAVAQWAVLILILGANIGIGSMHTTYSGDS